MSVSNQKRQKVDIGRFLDLEADVDKEDEDEDEVDEVDEMGRFIEDEDDDANLSHGEDDEDDGEDSNQSLPWQLKNPIAHAVSEHEQSEALAARYRHKERLPPATQTPRDEETITERLREIFGDSLAVTMTVDDSPLWQVPVKSGSEEAAVWYILQRTQVLGGQSLVKSAFARSMVPGYIFVEASSISTVRDICDGFVGYRRRLKITPVNIGDAVALLKLQPFDLMLREGSWVRIKRGAYAEDLAYLYHLDMTELNERRLQRTRGTACVRVIPRIVTGPVSSPAVIRASYVNGEARPSGAEQSLKRKHGVPRAARATQRLFDPLTWPEEAAEKIHDPGTWVFRNAVYKDGLMDLRVPINPLNLGIATPSRAELRSWSLCSDEAVRMLVLHSFKVLADEFWVDDRVEVTRGDWQGRIGTVQAVEENLLSVLLWKDTLIGDEGPRQFSTMQVGIRTSSVRKLFKIGDFVEAVSEDDHPRQGFVVAIHQIDGSHSNVTIMEQSCQNEFVWNSTTLHLRDLPCLQYSVPPGASQSERKLLRLAPRDTKHDLSMQRSHLQNLWKGMPVVVIAGSIKGYRGDIRTVHERFQVVSNPYKLPLAKTVQHQCLPTCRRCAGIKFAPHDCSIKCERCRLDRQLNHEDYTPNLKERGLVLGDLEVVTVDVYIAAQSRVHTVDIVDIQPTEDILPRDAYLNACRVVASSPTHSDSNVVNCTSQRWQAATLKLIQIQHVFRSRAFSALCFHVVQACEKRECESRLEHLPPCKHDIDSHNIRVRMQNKFCFVPFWYEHMREFDTICLKIVGDCEALRCEQQTDKDKPLPPCEHNTASHDARLSALWSNYFNFVPSWHRVEPPQGGKLSGGSASYLPSFEHDKDQQPHAQTHAQTPMWEPEYEYPDDPAWNPSSWKDPYWEPEREPERDTYSVDDDWLDQSLRGLQTVLWLNMASGSRSHSHNTEGVSAKLIPSPERGNIVNVQLLWDQNPGVLHGVPIRCVLPRHPGPTNKGDPIVFIRGPSKGQFGVIKAIDGERAMVSAYVKKKDRRKRAGREEPTEHAIHDLSLCQWPKNT